MPTSQYDHMYLVSRDTYEDMREKLNNVGALSDSEPTCRRLQDGAVNNIEVTKGATLIIGETNAGFKTRENKSNDSVFNKIHTLDNGNEHKYETKLDKKQTLDDGKEHAHETIPSKKEVALKENSQLWKAYDKRQQHSTETRCMPSLTTSSRLPQLSQKEQTQYVKQRMRQLMGHKPAGSATTTPSLTSIDASPVKKTKRMHTAHDEGKENVTVPKRGRNLYTIAEESSREATNIDNIPASTKHELVTENMEVDDVTKPQTIKHVNKDMKEEERSTAKSSNMKKQPLAEKKQGLVNIQKSKEKQQLFNDIMNDAIKQTSSSRSRTKHVPVTENMMLDDITKPRAKKRVNEDVKEEERNMVKTRPLAEKKRELVNVQRSKEKQRLFNDIMNDALKHTSSSRSTRIKTINKRVHAPVRAMEKEENVGEMLLEQLLHRRKNSLPSRTGVKRTHVISSEEEGENELENVVKSKKPRYMDLDWTFGKRKRDTSNRFIARKKQRGEDPQPQLNENLSPRHARKRQIQEQTLEEIETESEIPYKSRGITYIASDDESM